MGFGNKIYKYKIMSTTTKQNKKNDKNNNGAGQDLRWLLWAHLYRLSDAENQFIKIVPSILKKVTNVDLKNGIEDHFDEVKAQAERLAKASNLMSAKPQKVQSQVMHGLLADMGLIIELINVPEVRDAAILEALRCIKHCEIAGYSSAIEWARLLEEDGVADLLEDTLEEEAAFDELLGDLAEEKINESALGEGSDEDDAEDDEEEDE